MKNSITIKLALLCVVALCLLSFKIGQSSKAIETENKIVFVWEGMESDIPADGNQLINLSTNENIVYLNPAD